MNQTVVQKKKLVRLELDLESHALLRSLAGSKEMPMSQFVRELVQKEIAKNQKKKS